jgi:hypothetical protein
MTGKYIPVIDQCWISRCRNRKMYTVVINGVEHKVCTTHAKTYGVTVEERDGLT